MQQPPLRHNRSAAAVAPMPIAATALNGADTLPVPVNTRAIGDATTTILNPGVVSWVHFGDLHITTADQQNYIDLQTIIAQTNQYLKNGVNFAVLPGDNANDDTEAEYQLIKQATDQLHVPLYAIPGDNDSKDHLTLYNRYLEPQNYYSFSAGGYHFAFTDVMSGIRDAERSWLTTDLDSAKQQGLKNVVFMHSMALAPEIQDLILRDGVMMVGSGHTHYNAVANDDQTIYAAGRNTGQATDGPVGFEMVTLDNGVVSWKFKPLGTWPFVMITTRGGGRLGERQKASHPPLCAVQPRRSTPRTQQGSSRRGAQSAGCDLSRPENKQTVRGARRRLLRQTRRNAYRTSSRPSPRAARQRRREHGPPRELGNGGVSSGDLRGRLDRHHSPNSSVRSPV